MKRSSDEILRQIKEHVGKGTYLVKQHAIQKQKERLIRLPDILYVLEKGGHEREKDEFDIRSQGWKYAIRGKTIDHVDLRVIVALYEKKKNVYLYGTRVPN